MYKEYKIDKATFLGGWYIPESVCDELIETYYNNEFKWGKGTVGDNKLVPDAKKSTEMVITPNEYNVYAKNYLSHLSSCLEEYKKKYPYSNSVAEFSCYENIKIQHYKPGEGFYNWHAENEGYGETKLRHLVFMTYLNTVDNAGTEFYHQDITTPCEKGLTVIWPSAWTHFHRGVTNNEKEKFIITGWFDFYE